eukprot:74559-Amphidinium_carterae.1
MAKEAWKEQELLQEKDLARGDVDGERAQERTEPLEASTATESEAQGRDDKECKEESGPLGSVDTIRADELEGDHMEAGTVILHAHSPQACVNMEVIDVQEEDFVEEAARETESKLQHAEAESEMA